MLSTVPYAIVLHVAFQDNMKCWWYFQVSSDLPDWCLCLQIIGEPVPDQNPLAASSIAGKVAASAMCHFIHRWSRLPAARHLMVYGFSDIIPKTKPDPKLWILFTSWRKSIVHTVSVKWAGGVQFWMCTLCLWVCLTKRNVL